MKFKKNFPFRYLRTTPERAVPIICSCFYLHNVARYRRDHINDELNIEVENNIPPPVDVEDDKAFRDYIAATFFR